MEFFRKLFETDFMPHGHCYFWLPEILWPHVLGDAATALAYFVIPIFLYRYVKARPDIKYSYVFLAFSLFILFCGITHALAVVSVWQPIYRIEAVAKVTTALISIATVGLLFRLYHPLLAIPSPQQLERVNQDLRQEIEQRKKTEEELQRSQRDITTLNAQLEAKVRQRTLQLELANRDLQEFNYAVSHDLRAPLKSISGLLDIFTDQYSTDLGEDGAMIIEHVETSVERMDHLIHHFLNFSELGQQVLQKEEIDIEKMFRTVFRELLTDYADKRVDFRVGQLPRAFGDPVLLRQVIQNLLSNALKYAAVRPVIEITVAGEVQNDQLVYEVRDNGVGFSPDAKHRLFKMFQRLHAKEEFSGYGIGLAFSKRIIDKHGGDIWVDSEPDRGSSFYFSLPS